MAEGVTIENPTSGFTTRYFCHSCHKDVIIQSKEIQCPDCQSECIEELSLDANDPKSFGQLINFLDEIPILSQSLLESHRRILYDEDDDDPEFDFEPNISEHLANHLELPYLGDSDYDLGLESNFDLPDHFYTFRNLEDSFNSDDDVVDNLASQLLDEIEISGPPPLKKEQIKALPNHTFTKEQETKKVQCTVCMEDFKVGEEVKKLTCEHLFHEKCITPWLEKQASCPNCRLAVKVESARRQSQPALRRPLNSRNTTTRRFSESSTIGDYFNAMMSPFRFL